MPRRFDDWVRSTLNSRHDVRPRAGEVRRIIADLQPRRPRLYRVALTAGSAVIVVALVLLANPRMIGSNSGRHEITRMLPDGRFVIQQPLTGAGTVVKSAKEIEEWDRVAERTAAGEEEVYEYGFTRYQGKTIWSVGYKQKDDGNKIRSRAPTYEPRTNLSLKAYRKISPYLEPLVEAAEARPAVACPPERHVVDGVPVEFEVWAADIPGVGRIEYGVGKPPVQ